MVSSKSASGVETAASVADIGVGALFLLLMTPSLIGARRTRTMETTAPPPRIRRRPSVRRALRTGHMNADGPTDIKSRAAAPTVLLVDWRSPGEVANKATARG